MPEAGHGHLELVGALQQTLFDAMREELGSATRVALLDFPNHANIGDSAIYAGEVVLLRALGVEIVHAADQRGYQRQHLASSLAPDDVILLHGGGNLGDYYPRHQALRERVVRDFGNHRVVVLPQSLAVEDDRSLEQAARLFASHGGVSVVVRETLTARRFPELFPGVAHRMAPDSAHFLGALPRWPAQVDVAWLRRTDGESATTTATAHQPDATFDWPVPSRAWRAARMSSRLASLASDKAPAATGPLARAAWRAFEPLARDAVGRGARALSRGRVLVTDRLHAHILATLAGQPHVLLDNVTGKVRAYHETWTHPFADCVLADDVDQAVAWAREMAAGRPAADLRAIGS